jgi:hypothetical protein
MASGVREMNSTPANERGCACFPAILEWRGSSVTVNAHFDGKVIVPDERLDLPPNQALILQIQPVNGEGEQAEESALAWIAANAVDSEALPEDLADRHDLCLPQIPS